MNIKCAPFKTGEKIIATAAAAIVAGVPQWLGQMLAIPERDVVSGDVHEPIVSGLMKGKFTTTAGNAGDNVWWDADGSPYGGTASSGAFTVVASDGDYWAGTLAEALAAADGEALFYLNKENPALPSWRHLAHEAVSANKTLDAQDVGKVIWVDTDAKVITLPATVAGLKFIIANAGADGAVIVAVSPNANDKIMGADVAGVDNKDRNNTKTTAVHGDYIVLIGDGADGYFVLEERGTWAAEA